MKYGRNLIATISCRIIEVARLEKQTREPTHIDPNYYYQRCASYSFITAVDPIGRSDQTARRYGLIATLAFLKMDLSRAINRILRDFISKIAIINDRRMCARANSLMNKSAWRMQIRDCSVKIVTMSLACAHVYWYRIYYSEKTGRYKKKMHFSISRVYDDVFM